MTNTASNKVKNSEIAQAFWVEKGQIMLDLLLRKASIHRSEAEAIDNGGVRLLPDYSG